MAPEVLRSMINGDLIEYTEQIDLYSLGIIFYNMVLNRKPYFLFETKYEKLVKSQIDFPLNSLECVYLFSKMAIMPFSLRKSFQESLKYLYSLDLSNLRTIKRKHFYSISTYASENELNVKIGYFNTLGISPLYILLMILIILALLLLLAFYIANNKKQRVSSIKKDIEKSKH